jgi:hypothetical protein
MGGASEIVTNGGAGGQVVYSVIPYDARAKVVCAPCNNGWMSQIENAASKLLKPMIGTHLVIPLDHPAQTTLGTWSVLKGLLVPYYMRQPDMFPRGVYVEFFRARRPSDQQHVVLARHNDLRVSGGAHSYRLDLTEDATGTTHPSSGYAVTFHIHRLVVYLFGHLLANQVQPPFPPALIPFIIQIWPVQSLVKWPPPQTMDVAALMALRRAFTP